ncbi:hypothetical protein V6N13_033881 [Hibiscus sabdariffa]
MFMWAKCYKRAALWRHLCHMDDSIRDPWIIVENFNATLIDLVSKALNSLGLEVPLKPDWTCFFVMNFRVGNSTCFSSNRPFRYFTGLNSHEDFARMVHDNWIPFGLDMAPHSTEIYKAYQQHWNVVGSSV